MRRALLAAGLACAVATAQAFEATLEPRAIEEAIHIGQSRIVRDRSAFHAPYRVPVAVPPLDYVEVVTPFRRVVLEAERHTAAGNRLFGQREAQAALAAAPGELGIYAELTFNPLNTFVAVPAYDLVLRVPGGTAVIDARTVARVPRYGPRVEGLLPSPVTAAPILPRTSQPILGATITAGFDIRLLDPAGRYELQLREPGKTLASVSIQLGAFR